MFLSLTILSGILQFAGYLYYITKTRKDDISPNPTTWLIFAFDTTLLTVLEAATGATWSLLVLPATCSLGGLYVAWLIRRSGRLTWPSDITDRYILIVAILISFIYTCIFILSQYELLPAYIATSAAIFFLMVSNTNTLVAFIPIIKEVRVYPLHEHSGPWSVWTIAYAILTLLTYMEVGFDTNSFILYIYPVSCLLLHGTISWLARDERKKLFSTV